MATSEGLEGSESPAIVDAATVDAATVATLRTAAERLGRAADVDLLLPAWATDVGLVSSATRAVAGDPAALEEFSAMVVRGSGPEPGGTPPAPSESAPTAPGAEPAEDRAEKSFLVADRVLASLLTSALLADAAFDSGDVHYKAVLGLLDSLEPLALASGAAKGVLAEQPASAGDLNASLDAAKAGRVPSPRKYPLPDGPAAGPLIYSPATVDVAGDVATSVREIPTWIIRAISPDAACPGETLELSGTGFGSVDGGVRFPGSTAEGIATPADFWSDTLIRVTVPRGALPGRLGLTGRFLRVIDERRWVEHSYALEIGRPGRCDAWFGGSEPQISAFAANGLAGYCPVEPGTSMTVAWNCAAGPNPAIDLVLSRRGIELRRWPQLPSTGALPIPVPSPAVTTDYTLALILENPCGRVTREVQLRVAPFCGLIVTGLEATQSLQYYGAHLHLADPLDQGPDNSLSLVSGKPTAIRTYLDCNQLATFDGGSVPGVTGTLRARRVHPGGAVTYLGALAPVNPGGTVRAQRSALFEPNRSDPNGTLNFVLPASWCTGRLQVDVELDPAGRIGRTSPDRTRLNERLLLDFTTRRVLNLRGVMVSYRGPDNAGNPVTVAAPNVLDLSATCSWMRTAFPLSDITFASAGSVALTFPLNDMNQPGLCSPNWVRLNAMVRQAAAADGNRPGAVYAGLVPGSVPAAQGGCGGNGVATAFVGDGQALGHEVGHALGFRHSPCGAVGIPDPDYPAYENYDTRGAGRAARTGEFGFDVETQSVYPPRTSADFMSYCDPSWVSLYSYTRLFNHPRLDPDRTVLGGGGLFGMPRPGGQRRQWLYTSGVLEADGSVTLDRLREAEGEPAAPQPSDSGAEVRLLDEADRVLSRAPVTVLDPDGGCGCSGSSGPMPFAVSLLPAPETHSVVVVRGDKELLRRTVPKAEPRVEAEFPAEGSTLTEDFVLTWSAASPEGVPLDYWVRWSADDGATWSPVVVGLDEPSCPIALASLPGGGKCRLQVVAHDGFHSVAVDSGPLVKAPAPRSVVVLKASGDPAPAVLTAEGWDPQVGSLPGEELHWSSDKDGELEAGKRLVVSQLSPGTHALTVTAAGAEPATVQITVPSTET